MTPMPKRTKDLTDIRAVIQRLTSEANRLRDQRDAERPGVLAVVRDAVALFELTHEEVFGVAPAKRKAKVGRSDLPAGAAGAGRKRVKKTSAVVSMPKYRDPTTGKTWTGRGPRPAWFVAAVSGGASLESLKV